MKTKHFGSSGFYPRRLVFYLSVQHAVIHVEHMCYKRLCFLQVFGKLLLHVKRAEEDAEANDLQEHVVGILFSRNKLTHLQKQVRVYVVYVTKSNCCLI